MTRVVGVFLLLALFVNAISAVASAQSPWSDPVPFGLPPSAGQFNRPLDVDFTSQGRGMLKVGDNPSDPFFAEVGGRQAGPFARLDVDFDVRDYATYSRDRFVVVGTKQGRSRSSVRAGFGRIGVGVGAVRRIGIGSAFPVEVAANRRGDIAVVFLGRDFNDVMLAYKPARRGFRRVVRLGEASNDFGFADAEVVVNERGDVLTTWVGLGAARRGGPGTPVVFARIVRADGRVGRRDRVGVAKISSSLSADFTNTRRAIVAWGFPPIGPEDVSGPLRVAYASTHGRFRRAQTIEAPQPGYATPRVAFTSRGEGLVVWIRRDNWPEGLPPPAVIRASTLGGIRFGPAQTIADDVAPSASPRLAIGPRGEALVAWASSEAAAVVRPPGGPFGAREPIAGAWDNAVPAINPRTGVPFVFAGQADRGALTYATRTRIGE